MQEADCRAAAARNGSLVVDVWRETLSASDLHSPDRIWILEQTVQRLDAELAA